MGVRDYRGPIGSSAPEASLNPPRTFERVWAEAQTLAHRWGQLVRENRHLRTQLQEGGAVVEAVRDVGRAVRLNTLGVADHSRRIGENTAALQHVDARTLRIHDQVMRRAVPKARGAPGPEADHPAPA